MNPTSRAAPLNPHILQEAAEWLVELEGDEPERPETSRLAFDEWLRRSPEHVRAFLDLVPIWDQAGAPELRQRSREELIELARRADVNVVQLGAARVSAVRPRESRSPRFSARFAALAAAFALVALSVWLYSVRHTYSTDIGEQRSLKLTDGSLVELNALSRVRVRFSGSERRVELLEGQALFKVAPDPKRPFLVRSSDTDVRALGTAFDVYRKRAGTVVTVLEGRVAIIPAAQLKREHRSTDDADAGSASTRDPAHDPARYPTRDPAREPRANEPPLILSAGEQVNVSGTAAPAATRPGDFAAATAWMQRRLMFQNTALADVAEEFNRYNFKPIEIDDARLREFRVSGTFSSTEPASLLTFLREQPGIRVTESESAVRIEATEPRP